MARFHQSPAVYVSGLRLQTGNLKRLTEFYTNVVGMVIDQEGEGYITLAVPGDKQGFLRIEQGDNVTPRIPFETGLFHFAILLPGRADLGRFIRHLENTGVRLEGASDHDVSEALYFSDPDGNGIEIYCDRKAENWKWENGSVFMTSAPLNFDGILSEGRQGKWTGMPEGTVLGHIHMQVNDLTAAERFYKDGLGLDLVCRFGGQALFLSTAGYHHHIGLNTWNSRGAEPPSETSAGIFWFDLTFPDEEMRKQTVARLESQGAMIDMDGRNYTVKDPAGNRIRLVAE
ncbi:VOC family protein [Alteribacter natronophilus]|uniref:VOC family protein n=1 Tax=Alteribacter natronophilus TaxID=2583810 RepID=UPI00110E2537|nr:VOC family protein [Alteribacter natronophilus]TMW70120.1 VOC family protein [Alteribacter natronophilus]